MTPPAACMMPDMSNGSSGDYFGAYAEARLVSDSGGEWARHDEQMRSAEEVRRFVSSLKPSGGPTVLSVVTTGGSMADRSAVGGLWLIDDAPRRATHLAGYGNNATNAVEWWEDGDADAVMGLAASAGVPQRSLLAGAVAAAKFVVPLIYGTEKVEERLKLLLAPADEIVGGSKKKSLVKAADASAKSLAEMFAADASLTRADRDAAAFAFYSIRHALMAAALVAAGRDGERESKEAVSLARRATQVEAEAAARARGDGRRGGRTQGAKDELAATVRGAVTLIAFLRALAGRFSAGSR